MQAHAPNKAEKASKVGVLTMHVVVLLAEWDKAGRVPIRPSLATWQVFSPGTACCSICHKYPLSRWSIQGTGKHVQSISAPCMLCVQQSHPDASGLLPHLNACCLAVTRHVDLHKGMPCQPPRRCACRAGGCRSAHARCLRPGLCAAAHGRRCAQVRCSPCLGVCAQYATTCAGLRPVMSMTMVPER